MADDDVSVGHTSSVGQLKTVAAIHPHRICADELELAVDVEAALLEKLAPRRDLRKFAAIDRPAGQEPLPRQGAARPLQHQDLAAALGVHHRRQREQLDVEAGSRAPEHIVCHRRSVRT